MKLDDAWLEHAWDASEQSKQNSAGHIGRPPCVHYYYSQVKTGPQVWLLWSTSFSCVLPNISQLSRKPHCWGLHPRGLVATSLGANFNPHTAHLQPVPGLVRKGRKISLGWGPHGATGSCHPPYKVPEGSTQQLCTWGSVKGKLAIGAAETVLGTPPWLGG